MAEHGGSRRFTLVDALRGIAATLVALYHFYGIICEHAGRAVLPGPIDFLLHQGRVGVEIFFVISGFVIAYSFRDTTVTSGYIGRFFVRRSLRLDPVYWSAMALAVGIIAWKIYVLGDARESLPTVGQVFLNVLYLQDVTGSFTLVGSSWSLCLEVQMYVIFAVLLALSQRIARSEDFRNRSRSLLVCFLPLTLYSLALNYGWLSAPWPGLCCRNWCLFLQGALVWWVLAGAMQSRYLLLYSMFLGGSLFFDFRSGIVVGLATATLLFLAGKRRRLECWLAHSVFQYLGRISYSLYLVHYVIGMSLARVLIRRWAPQDVGPFTTWSVMLAAGALSLAVSHLLYVRVEKPTLAWSRRIKLHSSVEPGGTELAVIQDRMPAETAKEQTRVPVRDWDARSASAA